MRIHIQIIAFLLCTGSILAQNSVDIQINHLLDGEKFELKANAENNLGNSYMLNRLEYYLSNFAFTHDGGQVTYSKDLYVLIDMSESDGKTTITLGENEINNLESVSFHFGVDSDANHGDPALWPLGHPLAPQFPSMHWGWAAGYRFIALEGMSGPSLNQELQFHCIGDEFHQKIELPVSMSGQDSYLVEIDAEYNNLLSDININGGFILHGGFGQIITLANNLIDNVFTTAMSTSTLDTGNETTFEIFPNPSFDGIFNVEIDASSADSRINVIDALGRMIYNNEVENDLEIKVSDPGIYFAILTDLKGQLLTTRKIIVH